MLQTSSCMLCQVFKGEGKQEIKLWQLSHIIPSQCHTLCPQYDLTESAVANLNKQHVQFAHHLRHFKNRRLRRICLFT